MREVRLSGMAGSQDSLLDIIVGFMYMISSGGLLDVSSKLQACGETPWFDNLAEKLGHIFDYLRLSGFSICRTVESIGSSWDPH